MFGWRDSYRVDIREIDEQHRELFGLIEQLRRATQDNLAPSALGALLLSIVSHAKDHFATEEQMMRQHQYPDIAIHKRLHDALLVQAVDVQEKAGRQELTLAIVTKFLEFWLAHHISEADRRLAQFLQVRGVK